MISILVDIASLNPKIYPVTMSILGFLLDKIQSKVFIDKAIYKLMKNNNNSYMQIWLQRAIIKLNIPHTFSEQICKEVDRINSLPKNKKYEVNLWNMDWLDNKKLKKLLKTYPIIDKQEIDKSPKYTESNEVNIFEYQ